MREEQNTCTVEEARERICPFAMPRAGAAGPTCFGEGCMAWRWSWEDSDGFEEHREQTLNWYDTFFATEEELMSPVDDLQAWLTIQLGDEAKAKELVDAFDGCDYDDYNEAFSAAGEAVNEALETVLTPKMDEWVKSHWPEGGWALKKQAVVVGCIVAVFQRPAKKRGSCGMVRR